MARPGPESEQARVKRWMQRIESANKDYKLWTERFRPDLLEKYVRGRQWAGLSDEDQQKRYTINLVASSIETAKPALFFNRPQIRCTAKPGRGDDFASDAEARARLCQDTIQTIIDDPDVPFAGETQLALHEAFIRFGVVEVGYTAEWTENPHAGKPVLKENSDDPMLDRHGAPVLQADKVVDREQFYVKRIPASHYRVPVGGKNDLAANDWVAYWEWQYVEDVKRSRVYKNTSGLKSSGVLEDTLRDSDGRKPDEERHGMVRLWKVWDLRTHKRHVLADGHTKFLLEDQDFAVLPHAVLKFYEQLDDFYPKPVVTDWIGPQDELNENREMKRAHRRRFYRRYLYRDGTMEPTELEKLETGGDGVYAKHTGAPGETPILPVPDAPLDGSIWRQGDEAERDFLQVSGIGGEARGVPRATTATQASIVDQRERLRESSARQKVGDWLAQIARLILIAARETSLPFWIKRNVDPVAPQAAEEAARVGRMWQQIQATDLADLDLDITVDLTALSPVSEDVQRAQWNQVLAIVANPTAALALSASEFLLRKTLGLYGIRGETEIREIQRAMGLLTQQMQAMNTAKAGAPGVTATAGPPAMGGPPLPPGLAAVLQGLAGAPAAPAEQ